MSEWSERDALLSLCASASLADHMGDMAAYIFKALEHVGIMPDVEDLDDLGVWLARNYGTTTLYGTVLTEDD